MVKVTPLLEAIDSSKPFKFIGPCDKLCDQYGVGAVKAMVAGSKRVPRRDFQKNCDLTRSFLARDETLGQWLMTSIQNDPNGTGLFKGELAGKPCFFAKTMGFEFVFAMI